ncbi:FecR family protein [Parapedobacter indicus]|uniref:FecR family protein n=1 Tax=Parapedobacter indicus TaxID=1477437 RepID=A0A1I3FEG6_9SPHI|nr:FecR family protein [Parapedobacter indicus]PPL03684.1 FecR family protein [Parapedobacter indicus]SFI09570.1 FecR family protein [Parapedobacter indicus]
MTNYKRHEELASKWLNGTISDAEKLEFAAWYEAHPDNRFELPASFASDEEELRKRILTKITTHMDLSKSRRIKLRYYWMAGIAAILLLSVSLGVYRWNSSIEKRADKQLSLKDVMPGGNRATLKLADGRVIDLSANQPGIIVGDEISYSDGSTVFDGTVSEGTLQLTTPKGGQYQLMLPDGSKIWLNSASSLQYPERFDGDLREVELLAGEAYFEIARQKNRETGKIIPFRVKTEDQTIEVLGTEFNVNAYKDENDIKTTLLGGSVRVVGNRNSSAVQILNPGEQAILRKDHFAVQKVNAEEFVAWKDGFFYFNDADVHEVMRQFERWYDIEVQYERSFSDDLFVGKIPRNVSLSIALEVLKNAGINFELKDEHHLIVKPRE